VPAFEFIPFDGVAPPKSERVTFTVPLSETEVARRRARIAELVAQGRVRVTGQAVGRAPVIAEVRAPSFADAELLLSGDDVVAPAELDLIVGYPFTSQFRVLIHAADNRGFTRRALFSAIVAVVESMYEGTTVKELTGLYNASIDSSRFGHASHAMTDLVIVGVRLFEREGRRCGWVEIES
jgi:hypothetical protein